MKYDFEKARTMLMKDFQSLPVIVRTLVLWK